MRCSVIWSLQIITTNYQESWLYLNECDDMVYDTRTTDSLVLLITVIGRGQSLWEMLVNRETARLRRNCCLVQLYTAEAAERFMALPSCV